MVARSALPLMGAETPTYFERLWRLVVELHMIGEGI